MRAVEFGATASVNCELPEAARSALPSLLDAHAAADSAAASRCPFDFAAQLLRRLGTAVADKVRSFHAGLDAVSAKAPADLRGTVASSFFIVMYLGISVPVIGEGIAETGLGLRTAGIAFSVVVAAIAAGALATLIPSRKGSTHAAPALSHSTP